MHSGPLPRREAPLLFGGRAWRDPLEKLSAAHDNLRVAHGMNDLRPDPDQLLAHVQAEEARAKRGRLRIFFGASAGVGKTYGMLEAAHNARAGASADVVVG